MADIEIKMHTWMT